jgi:hypothetical protein
MPDKVYSWRAKPSGDCGTLRRNDALYCQYHKSYNVPRQWICVSKFLGLSCRLLILHLSGGARSRTWDISSFGVHGIQQRYCVHCFQPTASGGGILRSQADHIETPKSKNSSIEAMESLQPYRVEHGLGLWERTRDFDAGLRMISGKANSLSHFAFTWLNFWKIWSRFSASTKLNFQLTRPLLLPLVVLCQTTFINILTRLREHTNSSRSLQRSLILSTPSNRARSNGSSKKES